MVSDPIGDMLVQIKNAYMAGKFAVVLPYSGLKESVAKVLKDKGTWLLSRAPATA